MFDISESTRRFAIWPWVMHYLLAVVTPLIALELLNGMIGFTYSNGSAGQVIFEYVSLSGIAFTLGIAVYISHPLTAGVARRSWMFPLCLFVLAMCWDLYASRFNWRAVVNGYIISLPGNLEFDERWDHYWAFSFPVVAAITYALGSRVSEAHIVKAPIPDAKP